MVFMRFIVANDTSGSPAYAVVSFSSFPGNHDLVVALARKILREVIAKTAGGARDQPTLASGIVF